MGEVKVLGNWLSPFSRRVELALKLKGIEYEYIEQNLAEKSSLLLETNPIHKKVPVLIHNGKPIVESLVILEYIDETWKGHPIFPTDPYDRAMARFWANFIDQKCNGATWKILSSKGEEKEKAIEEARQHLKALESELKDKKYFGGESIGAVDIAASFIGYWAVTLLEAMGIDMVNKENFPNVCNWIHEYVSCDIVRENLPPRNLLFDKFVQLLQPPFNANDWYY